MLTSEDDFSIFLNEDLKKKENTLDSKYGGKYQTNWQKVRITT